MSNKKKFLNVITHILAYDSKTTTDNPIRRYADWARRIFNIPVQEPVSSHIELEPLTSRVIFDGSRTHNLVAGTSLVSLALIDSKKSKYRLSTDELDAFRSSRVVASITDCQVTVNNNSVVIFDFGAANLAAVQVGDIMRIKTKLLYDDQPFAFNPLNGGYWKILSVAAGQVQAVRMKGEAFSAVNETVQSVAGDVEFFSAQEIQVGDKVKISGTLSSVSHRIYNVADVNPQYIDLVSSQPLPEEEDVEYQADSIVFYTQAKKLLYIESDQELVIRVNGDTSENITIIPVIVGDANAPAYFHMWGEVYKLELLNKSVNSATILCIEGE